MRTPKDATGGRSADRAMAQNTENTETTETETEEDRHEPHQAVATVATPEAVFQDQAPATANIAQWVNMTDPGTDHGGTR